MIVSVMMDRGVEAGLKRESGGKIYYLKRGKGLTKRDDLLQGEKFWGGKWGGEVGGIGGAGNGEGVIENLR